MPERTYKAGGRFRFFPDAYIVVFYHIIPYSSLIHHLNYNYNTVAPSNGATVLCLYLDIIRYNKIRIGVR